MFEDLIFYTTLTGSVTLACYYKRIDDIITRRNYGVGLGILIACLICGTQIYHTILMVWGNVVIIKFSDKNFIHLISLIWTWLYLLYLHIHVVNAEYVIWYHQTLALRLVGIAFEMHGSVKPSPKASSSGRINSTGDTDHDVEEPSVVDIVTYAFFFIGLHKGPYYKWKILNDHLHGSFGVLGDCRIITEQKIKKIFICVAGYSLLRMKYSPYIYSEESFYTRYDMDTRYLYNIPLLLMFFLQSQIIMLLSTSACTEAGFGVYPAKTQPLPGHGPSVRHSLLKLSGTPEKALEQEYNFSMLKCFENERLLIGPRMKDTMKSWDMSTRYWFWAYIYKNLVKANKEVRGICSYLAWTLWSGPSIQQLIISSTLWVYIHLESEYGDIYETSTSVESPVKFAFRTPSSSFQANVAVQSLNATEFQMKVPWDIGFSIMRMFCLIYLTPCFIVSDAAVLLKYYNSIFWVYHVILLVFIVGAIVIYKSRESS